MAGRHPPSSRSARSARRAHRTRAAIAAGVVALGISGYSDVLTSFKGGPGQLAVHGTSNPGQVGQNISNGCVRVPTDIIEQIAARAPLGTPVTIVA